MAAQLTVEPLKITYAQATELATLLSGGDDETTWQAYVDPNNRSDYAREERATLRYAGTDPLLQGAALDCWTALSRGTQYQWRANVRAGVGATTKYVPDTLPYKDRDNFVSLINISTTKTLPRMAKEISTRLLAHYLPAYRQAMGRLQEEQAQQAADIVLADELAMILGTTVRTHPHSGSKAPLIYHTKASLSINAGHVQLERGFSMTPQQARELCALVATWTEDK